MGNFRFNLGLFLGMLGVLVAQEPATGNDEQTLKGWAFDLGGQYAWASLTAPQNYAGSIGGVIGRITYQKPWSFFGQLKSFYNSGQLSNSQDTARFSEWDTEVTAGYCVRMQPRWTLTPYAGVGYEAITNYNKAYSDIEAITLKYKIGYAVFGFDSRYSWDSYYVGLQVDCLPSFGQTLLVIELPQAQWTLKNRVGAAARLPVGFKCAQNIWLEVAPYYRFVPIGSSSQLELSARNLMQWGAFVSLRFFL